MSNSIQLLLVEDEPLIALSTQDALEEGGFSVVVASNGQTAIEILDGRIDEIAGIVTDVRLGAGPDGWQVARHARALNPAFPIVYATGDGAADWPIHGVPESVVVQKPYAPAQLLTAIATLLNRGKSQAAA